MAIAADFLNSMAHAFSGQNIHLQLSEAIPELRFYDVGSHVSPFEPTCTFNHPSHGVHGLFEWVRVERGYIINKIRI